MYKINLIVLFLLMTLLATSQNVVIKGVAANQSNKMIRIITYSDLFSGTQKTLATTQTNSNGEFVIKLNVNSTMFSFLAFELDKGEFYLSPGSTYDFIIHTDTSSNKGSIFDRLPLSFSLHADDSGIQQSIEEFNIANNDFIYKNINAIYKSRNKSIVTNYVKSAQAKYSSNSSSYVRNYVKYSLSSLLWLSKKESNIQILKKYFIGKPVLYTNIQYVDFFKEFFDNYFDSRKLFSYSDLILSINDNDSINSMQNLFSLDSLLSSDRRVSELVEMYIMSKNYYVRDVEKESVITKLKYIGNNSIFIENRTIAKNFITALKEMQHDSPAPKFNLENISGENISLKNYSGKFVLLAFVKDNCNICMHQMQQIEELQNKLGNKFEIVTIVAGEKVKNISDFASKNGFKWQILKTGRNLLLLEDYNIKAYPTYIFINPDGTIAYAYLPMPKENMETYLQRFMDLYNSKLN